MFGMYHQLVFPLIVNFGLLLLGISLLVFSIKRGGYAFVKSLVTDRERKNFSDFAF